MIVSGKVCQSQCESRMHYRTIAEYPLTTCKSIGIRSKTRMFSVVQCVMMGERCYRSFAEQKFDSIRFLAIYQTEDAREYCTRLIARNV